MNSIQLNILYTYLFINVSLIGWIRPSSTVLSGTLLAFEQTTNVNDASLKLSGNSLVLDLGGTSTTFPISYTAADVDNWHYFGVSLHRLSATQTRVCAVFGTSTESCKTLSAIFTLSGNDKIQVGSGFKGNIKEISVLDWPKVDYEFYDTIQTAGCTAWNGVACNYCPSTTGQCLSTCNNDEYGAACTACLSPYCDTCYAGTNTQCYSCLPNYDFDYAGQSCPAVCGNGIRDTTDGEG